MRGNVQHISEANIQKTLRQLYIETDYARRAIYRNLFRSELKRVEAADLRLQTLRNCLSDCDRHVVRHRAVIAEQRSIGVDVGQAEIQLDNVLDVRATLRIELRKELSEA